jgi:sterol O-acyltransferase
VQIIIIFHNSMTNISNIGNANTIRHRCAGDKNVKDIMNTDMPSISKNTLKNIHKANKFQREKIFKARESRLTEMLDIADFRTVYNIFFALLVTLFVSILFHNYFETGDILRLKLLYQSFGILDQVFMCWLSFMSYALLSFTWKFVNSNSLFAISTYVLLQFAFLAMGGSISILMRPPPASGFIVMCELVRLAMKVHSYFRELQKGNVRSTSFIRYVYFLFAPSLLYRDEYPRTGDKVNWKVVSIKFAEVLLVVLYIYVIFERYCIPQFENISQEPNNAKVLIQSVFNSMIPGTLVFVFGFFGLLHCWLNAWAELLLFADKQFYRDWWNSNSFGEFYPKWNGVVHDWLYNYVYLDTLKLFKGNSIPSETAITMCKLFVMQFSALIHEFIIACSIGFFFPVLWVLFGGPGVIFMMINSRGNSHQAHNIFLWTMLIIGNGILTTLYCREYYMREMNDDFISYSSWKNFLIL